MLISAELTTANSPIAREHRQREAGRARLEHPEQRAAAGGGQLAGRHQHRREHRDHARRSPRPRAIPSSIARGKIRSGSWHSSAMFTESSKPTIAKNASEVAAVIARNAPVSPVSIWVSRDGVAARRRPTA